MRRALRSVRWYSTLNYPAAAMTLVVQTGKLSNPNEGTWSSSGGIFTLEFTQL